MGGRAKLIWGVLKPALALVAAVIIIPLLKVLASDAGLLGRPGQRVDPLVSVLASSWFVGVASGIVCLLAGFYFGRALMGAIRQGRADRWLKAINPDEVGEALGLQTVGSTPRLAKNEDPALALWDPRSTLSLAMLHLAAHFIRWRKTRPAGPVLVTSTQIGEGKSTTSLGLAITLSNLSYRVLLVDADMLRPSLHRHLKTENLEGLAAAAAGNPIIVRGRYRTLDFLNAGKLSPGESVRAAHQLNGIGFWRSLQADYGYDFVLVDGPPLITAAAIELASGIDDVILAIAATTPLARARAMLDEMVRDREIEARVVLTMRPKSRGDDQGFWFYDYAYDYDYGSVAKGTEPQQPKAGVGTKEPAT